MSALPAAAAAAAAACSSSSSSTKALTPASLQKLLDLQDALQKRIDSSQKRFQNITRLHNEFMEGLEKDLESVSSQVRAMCETKH
jgi:hypothetical protein